MSLVLNISDLHCPYQHENAFDFLNDIKKKAKPDIVVLGGDELEMAGLNFHGQNPDMPSARDEFEAGKESLKTLFKIFPEMKCLTSNHTSLGFRRAFKYGIPSQFLKGYKELLEAPKGCNWRDYWEIDGVRYIHGEGFSGKNAATTAAMQYQMSIILNHIHTWGGVQYIQTVKGLLIAGNSGCLIDYEAMAFRWAKHYATKPTLGVILVEDGKKAYFEPLPK